MSKYVFLVACLFVCFFATVLLFRGKLLFGLSPFEVFVAFRISHPWSLPLTCLRLPGPGAALAGDHVPPGEAVVPRVPGNGRLAHGHDGHRVPGGCQGAHRCRRGGLLHGSQPVLQKLGEHGFEFGPHVDLS